MKMIKISLAILASMLFSLVLSRRDYIEADYVKGPRECKRLGLSHIGYFNSEECKQDCCSKVKGCEGGCTQSIVRIPKLPTPENTRIRYYSRGVCCAKKARRIRRH